MRSESDSIASKYRKYRNKLRLSIHRAEVLYYNNLFENSKQASQNLWKHLGSVINPTKRSKLSTIDKLLINGRYIKDKKWIANAMNEHFCTVGTRLQQHLAYCEPNSFSSYLSQGPLNSFYLSTLEYQNVLQEIKKIESP